MQGPVLSVEIQTPLGRTEADGTLDVSFEVPPGVTVLFGPSGAGKSRTLASIAGIARPRRGRVACGDLVWSDARTFVPVHERRVALVFQSLALFPHLSVLENVVFGIPRDVPAAERRAVAEATLERMHVAHVASRRPRSLSGGEAQRVALARAIATKPRVLLLDEPFSALDASLKEALLREVRTWVDDAQLPVVFVTHDATEAKSLGDRVLFLEKGRITRSAEVDEAFSAR